MRRCVVVLRPALSQRQLEERTTDYYSQDSNGNVWYFGENTAKLDEEGRAKKRAEAGSTGVQRREGRDLHVHAPEPGPAPRVRCSYKGQAEDHFQVLGSASVKVPFITTRHALLTKEWTPLEPGVIDHKFYVRGIGTVLERTAKGPLERNELVSFRRGA